MNFLGINNLDLRLVVPSALIFFAVLILVPGLVLMARAQANKKIRDRLEDVVYDRPEENLSSTILRDVEMSNIPLVNRMLQNANWARRLEILLVQADIKMKTGAFVMMMLVIGLVVWLGADMLLKRPFVGAALGAMAGTIPIFVVRYKKQKRTLAFEEQFPDALDMLTSALRAGLALTAAVQVVAEEAPDPVGKEFRVLFEENRLGLDMKHAVQMMSERVDSTEARLFATALILQRETGGNLAEALSNLSGILRARKKMADKVRAMSSEAKMTAMIIGSLPFILGALIYFMNPEYMSVLFTDPTGRTMTIGGLLWMSIGIFIMKQMVSFKV